MGWSRSISMPLERRVSVTWSRSGALRPCIGRGFDADDVLRISGRHLRLVVILAGVLIRGSEPPVSVAGITGTVAGLRRLSPAAG